MSDKSPPTEDQDCQRPVPPPRRGASERRGQVGLRGDSAVLSVNGGSGSAALQGLLSSPFLRANGGRARARPSSHLPRPGLLFSAGSAARLRLGGGGRALRDPERRGRRAHPSRPRTWSSARARKGGATREGGGPPPGAPPSSAGGPSALSEQRGRAAATAAPKTSGIKRTSLLGRCGRNGRPIGGARR